MFFDLVVLRPRTTRALSHVPPVPMPTLRATTLGVRAGVWCRAWTPVTALTRPFSACADGRLTWYLFPRSCPLDWPSVVAGAFRYRRRRPARAGFHHPFVGMAPMFAGISEVQSNIWCSASNSTPIPCGGAGFADRLPLRVVDGGVSGASRFSDRSS